MVIETYKITIKSDGGTFTVILSSLSGKKGAINQVLASELCPIGAIFKVEKINQKIIN